MGKRTKRVLLSLGAVLGLLALTLGILWLYFQPAFSRTNSIVYGQRNGRDLVIDVLRPRSANGLGVLVLMSGGWKSPGGGSLGGWMAAPLLRRGYTVIPVYHVSQPDATVMEIFEDMERAVRFVRHRAKDYGIDPSRIAVTGGSAGGHLSLLLATRGGPGKNDAPDPIERESSAVQAVAIFYPATDLLNLGASTENPGDGGPPKSFVKAFGPDSTNLATWKVIGRDMSPIYHVHSNLPPILIYHGDADTLVPLDQSTRFRDAVREAGGTIELVVHPGGKHGWPTMILDLRHFAAWFERHLSKQ